MFWMNVSVKKKTCNIVSMWMCDKTHNMIWKNKNICEMHGMPKMVQRASGNKYKFLLIQMKTSSIWLCSILYHLILG